MGRHRKPIELHRLSGADKKDPQRYRGEVPRGWDKIAHCAHCGPVYSDHDLDTLSCGWCDMRLAGKWFPQPE